MPKHVPKKPPPEADVNEVAFRVTRQATLDKQQPRLPPPPKHRPKKSR